MNPIYVKCLDSAFTSLVEGRVYKIQPDDQNRHNGKLADVLIGGVMYDIARFDQPTITKRK